MSNPTIPNPIRIHGFSLSGHSHRIELFANLTGIEHEMIEVDFANGAHKQEAFLSLNPSGQVPVIEDGDFVLADSNAILVYLARKYAPEWLPEDAVTAARVQQILSLAAGELRYGPALARIITLFGAPYDADRAEEISVWLFDKLEAHLSDREWLAADRPTIADVAIYSYTARAPEGNISLEPYPRLRAWLARVEQLPGFVPIVVSKVGLAV